MCDSTDAKAGCIGFLYDFDEIISCYFVADVIYIEPPPKVKTENMLVYGAFAMPARLRVFYSSR